MAVIEVKVPDIGDFKDVEVIELLVQPGERIAVEQSLLTVESDKASMEIPSSAAGIVKSLRIKIGDKVSEGSVIAELEADDARKDEAKPAEAKQVEAQDDGKAAAKPAPAPAPGPPVSIRRVSIRRVSPAATPRRRRPRARRSRCLR